MGHHRNFGLHQNAITQAVVDVLCIASAVLFVTTAGIGIAGIFFIVGMLFSPF